MNSSWGEAVKKKKKKTSRDKILDHIFQFGSITNYEAINWLGIKNLSEIIDELRTMGFQIKGEKCSMRNEQGERVYFRSYRVIDDRIGPMKVG